MSSIRFAPFVDTEPYFPPLVGTEGAAGFDIFLSQDVSLEAGQKARLPTNVQVVIPKGYVGLLQPRSSAHDKAIRIQTGIIDNDFRGPLSILAEATDKVSFSAGRSVAQLVVVPCLMTATFARDPVEVHSTARGDKGFGSTGF